MTYYLDASVVLGAVLDQDLATKRWFESVVGQADLFSSVLLQVEVARTLRRESRPLDLADQLLATIMPARVSPPIIGLAKAIEPHVKALDAIHLATLMHIDHAATMVTSDAQLMTAAKRLGIGCLDPSGPGGA